MIHSGMESKYCNFHLYLRIMKNCTKLKTGSDKLSFLHMTVNVWPVSSLKGS